MGQRDANNPSGSTKQMNAPTSRGIFLLVALPSQLDFYFSKTIRGVIRFFHDEVQLGQMIEGGRNMNRIP